MRYLNLGCGNRYHPEWINIDLLPRGPGVLVHDLSKDFPFRENSCDVVYSSHFLEHLPRSAALPFMKECYRILRPKGIVRAVVPDLERICQLYLQKLGAVLSGEKGAAADYEWMMLEMYDQTVRESPGGDMMAYLSQNPIPNETFICSRIGEEAREIVRSMKDLGAEGGFSELVVPRVGRRPFSRLYRLLRGSTKTSARRFYKMCLGALRFKALCMGEFRLKGEVHHWMYDRYSLSDLMLHAGFDAPRITSATLSHIPNWTSFNLDTLPDGTVIRPDSLFMEAAKP
jgi:predicted SAM-dependent methyltransferase